MLLISIPEPCHENWDKMSPREQGAFCGVCSKTVVDFTSLSDEQVKNYFLANRDKKTCGRFRNDQLNIDAHVLSKVLSGDIAYWKKFMAAVVILFGTLLTSCNSNVKGQVALPARRKIIKATLTELSSFADSTKPLLLQGKATVVCTTTVGFAAPELLEEHIMGDAIEVAPLPVLERPDSAIRKDSVKQECDNNKKDSLTYW